MSKFFSKNPTLAMAAFAVIICCFRFLFDGVELPLFGMSITIPHTDSTAYAAFLTPILSVHGYIHRNVRHKEFNPVKTRALTSRVDNPDAN